MRLVLDTNILVSALITRGSPPDGLYQGWQRGEFVLLTSLPQLAELERVVYSPKLQRFIKADSADDMLFLVRQGSEIITDLPTVFYSADTDDNVIIATALKGRADYLVTGDKKDILHLQEADGVRFVTARQMLDIIAEQ